MDIFIKVWSNDNYCQIISDHTHTQLLLQDGSVSHVPRRWQLQSQMFQGNLTAQDREGQSGATRAVPQPSAGSPGLLLPAGVVESLEGSEVPPRGWEPILQELPTALARSLEQLYVTP